MTPRMVRVTLEGAELTGLPVPEPAASVRLLIPSSGHSELVMPEWNGNEFLLPHGQRPIIRTFTPRFYRPELNELDLDIVIHEGGATSGWVLAASPGDPVAISGPGRGYSFDPTASRLLLAGDETAIPAIAQLLEALPHDRATEVLIEVPQAWTALEQSAPAGTSIRRLKRRPTDAPGVQLLAAIQDMVLDPGTHIWAAGEAAAMHRIRQHLFKARGLPRSQATVRGYWKLRD